MRHLTLVGVIRNRKVVELARWCAWCQTPMSAEDAAKLARGARKTHGMCDPCAASFLAQMGPENDPAA